jgi:hypothetical protein
MIEMTESLDYIHTSNRKEGKIRAGFSFHRQEWKKLAERRYEVVKYSWPITWNLETGEISPSFHDCDKPPLAFASNIRYS